jgi:hypothetical protein
VTISKSGSEALGRKDELLALLAKLVEYGLLSGLVAGLLSRLLLSPPREDLRPTALGLRVDVGLVSMSDDDTDPGGSGCSRGSCRRFHPALTARLRNDPGLVSKGLGRGLALGLSGLAGPEPTCFL